MSSVLDGERTIERSEIVQNSERASNRCQSLWVKDDVYPYHCGVDDVLEVAITNMSSQILDYL